MPRRALCAVCQAPIQLGSGSLPSGQATCRPCRKVDPKPLDSTKCGTPLGRDQHRHHGEPACEACRMVWNQVSRERQRGMRAAGWVRPGREAPKTAFRSGTCSRCGKALARAAKEDPRCAACWGNKPGYNIAISRENRLAIYERDGWTCQLCQELVDPTLDPRTRWGATLDHILPRSHGGGDAPDNLRLAHRRCNAARGNPLPMPIAVFSRESTALILALSAH